MLVQDWDGNLERTFLYQKDGEIIEYVAPTKKSNKDANISKMGGWKNLSKTMAKKEVFTLNSQNDIDTNGLNIEIDSLNLPFFSITDFTNIYKDVDGNCWLNIREVPYLSYDGSGNIDGGGVTLYRERRGCGDDVIAYPGSSESPKDPGGGVGPGRGPGYFPHPPNRNCTNILYPEDYTGPKECIEELEIDCTGKPGGWAYIDPDCKTCIGGTTGRTECPPKEIRDSVQNPCIKDQLNLARTAKTTILNMLNNTFGGTIQFEDLSLTFKDITTLSNTIDGTMQRLSGIEYEISLNKNKLPNASKEYILATIYHEILHAFIESKLVKGSDGKYVITDQHQQMATDYVTLMTGALQVAFPNLSNNEAWALSWGGLEKTPFYTTKLTNTQRTQINDLNNKHKDKLATDKLGTYCN